MTTSATSPRVLITRPAAQVDNFQSLCHDAGLNTVSLPCIEIQFLEASLRLDELQQSELVFFTSANAVEGARRVFSFPWSDVSVCAIGPATERALAKSGQPVVYPATAPYNSEALLERLKIDGMPRALTIIKGEGGREWLIDNLNQEGVRVTSIDVYRRTLPSIDDATRRAIFEATPIDIISVTSDEVLKNLMQLAGEAYREQLLALPLICNSQRCAELAANMGFIRAARVAAQPEDAGQLALLHQWLRDRMQNRTAEI